MSYELVRSINTKKQTFTSAANNVRPLIYSSGSFYDNENDTEKDFIMRCLIDFNDGNFHSSSDKVWRFEYAIQKFNRTKKELSNYINDIRWNSYYYKDGKCHELYTTEERINATEILKEELYRSYMSIEETKKRYIISLDNYYYVNKVNERSLKYSYVIEQAKVFDSLEQAQWYKWTKIRDRFNGSFNIVELKESI